ncbi:MAG: extracellular solute-binding protein [Ignavibacteriales bacterium]|nr:extracellular solute-binding protein [Ignavibacteriales bacterium]
MNFNRIRIAFLLFFLSLLSTNCSEQNNKDEILIWHTMRPEETAILQEQLDEFMSENPGVTVTQVFQETEKMRSDFIVASIGGYGPDLVYGPADQIGPFSEIDVLRPMNDLFNSQYLSNFDSKALIYVNGHLLQIADKLGNHLTLVYNKKLVPTPPKSSGELIDIGKKLTIDQNNDGRIDQYGLVWNYTEPYFFIPFLTGFGGWVLDSANFPTLNTPEMVNALRFIQDLRDKYKIIPNEADYEVSDALFKEGKAAMIINGDWSWSGYGAAGIDYGISPLPMIDATGKYCSPTVAPKGYSINKNVSPDKIYLIKKLLEKIFEPANQIKTALATKTLPTRKEVFADSAVINDPILINSKKQIDLGTALPIITEMRAIWNAMRPVYQAALSGNISPEKAAAEMQKNTLKNIKDLRESYDDPVGGLIVQILLIAIVVVSIFMLRRSISAFFSNLKKDGLAYIFALPALIVMVAVIFYPFAYNIVISFSNMNLSHMKDWSIVGFVQYVNVFREPQFYSIFLKTIVWTTINVTFHVVIGVSLALLLNKNLPGSKIFRVLLILPWAIPQYIVALTWRGMFNYEYGAINLLISNFLFMSPVEWLKSPMEAFVAVIITNIWLGFPFMMIIALGGLQSIPQELYEAADIDGAKWFHKLKNITIPLIRPVMLPAITLGVIWTFNSINVVWLVSNAGEPSDKTHILVSYVYKAAFNFYRYGFAAAFSMVIFLILLAFGVTFLRKTRATESVY